jgi:DNA polymerase IV
MTLRCLFVDFNSYFASVEQQDDPSLRGRPVAVAPVMAESTCCIAASYEAKAFGIKTGTPVWEARERCPEIVVLEGRPSRYIDVHHQLMDAIQDCIPHGKAESIDEVPCWLIGRERERANAEAIAGNIKRSLLDRGFDAIRCSIGIAPNKFLAKTASDMKKPDGLTVIEQSDLPNKLHDLELRDFCGIGPSMERRLQRADIRSVEQLCAASREHLRAAWGSIEGERYWMQLRGFELPERKSERASLGHSHVLGPELRNYDGARSVLFKLLAKAAMRLRNEEFLAGGLAIRMRFAGMDKRFERDLAFAPIDDTPTFLKLLGRELEALERALANGRWKPKRYPPLSVSVTLVRLERRGSLSGELMTERRRSRDMSAVLDKINKRYGNNALYFGAMQNALSQQAAPMRIAFGQIPQTSLEEDVGIAHESGAHESIAHEHLDGHELWLKRERQFKVLAETAHREAREKSRRPRA